MHKYNFSSDGNIPDPDLLPYNPEPDYMPNNANPGQVPFNPAGAVVVGPPLNRPDRMDYVDASYNNHMDYTNNVIYQNRAL